MGKRATRSQTADSEPKKQKIATDPVELKKQELVTKLAIPRCLICQSKLGGEMLMCVANKGRCGETYHDHCITQWLSTTMQDGYNGSCPKCKQEFLPARNRALEDTLEMQGTACINRARGCSEFLPRREMELHYGSCPFRLMECSAAQYKCDWSGLESDRAPHEKQCVYVQFGQQAVDTERSIEKAGARAVARVEASIAELKKLKALNEKRIQQFAQLTSTLSVDGCTKHYVVAPKSREWPLNVQDCMLKLNVVVDDVTRDVCFEVHGIEATRYPVAVCTIAFLLTPDEHMDGEKSRTDSFVLHNETPHEVLRTKLKPTAPSDLPLDFKLAIKLFY